MGALAILIHASIIFANNQFLSISCWFTFNAISTSKNIEWWCHTPLPSPNQPRSRWHPAQRGNMDLQRMRCALPPPSSHYNTVQVLDDHHDTSIWYNCSWYKHIIYIYITASKIIIGIINHNHDFRYLLLPAVTKQDHSISLDWPFCSRILAIRSWLLHHLEDPLLRTRLRLSSGGKKPIIFACWCFFGCKWHFELEIL